MRPKPREAATSDTNCPSAVLTPPAPFVNVTSLENATSSNTRPQEVQHLHNIANAVLPRAISHIH